MLQNAPVDCLVGMGALEQMHLLGLLEHHQELMAQHFEFGQSARGYSHPDFPRQDCFESLLQIDIFLLNIKTSIVLFLWQ